MISDSLNNEIINNISENIPSGSSILLPEATATLPGTFNK